MSPVGGVLLTGGASTRFGAPKALLDARGERLVDRTARVLAEVAAPVVEVGPGYSALAATREDPPGEGPLAALAAGAAWLDAAGSEGAFLVVAVDLPLLSSDLLHWLADRPGSGTVVPRVDGIAQSLCGRYARDAGALAAALLAAGERSVRALLAASSVEYVDEDAWGGVAPRAVFTDVDTPADAARAGLEDPGGSLAPDV
jgi:molybdopterin-guanine dinucleotide biosynthesis protein A